MAVYSKNITDLSYNLDFAMKRIERYLELRSIQNNSKNETNNIKQINNKK